MAGSLPEEGEYACRQEIVRAQDQRSSQTEYAVSLGLRQIARRCSIGLRNRARVFNILRRGSGVTNGSRSFCSRRDSRLAHGLKVSPQRDAVNFPFPPRHNHGRHSVAQHVNRGAKHAHESINS